MKHFALSALAAVASAEYITWPITVDGSTYYRYVESKPWSFTNYVQGEIYNGPNNILFVRSSPDATKLDSSIYKPYVRGGAIEFDVNVANVGSGCATGVYLVETDNGNCGENPIDAGVTPMCTSLDMMQGNRFGFETKAHPCSNGTCDAISQCQYNVRENGKATYGADAFGPGGTMVDTTLPFHVKNEFVSTTDYQTLWKLRTRISQGGSEMVMEADCRDYLQGLSINIEGGMGIAIANYANLDFSEDFEDDFGQTPEPDCDTAISMIANLQVHQMYYTEDMPDPEPPTPEPPAPEPAAFEQFIGYTDYYGGYIWMYVKGLDGRSLTTTQDGLTMGSNNRAWIHDVDQDDQAYWSYWHAYLGGTLDFDVNVSGVDCASASGVYLVQLDDATCSWDPKASGEEPPCARVEIFEANSLGFNVGAYPCDGGACEAVSSTRQSVSGSQYGPGAGYAINTDNSFHVQTKFYATQDNEGFFVDLMRIETTLTQGGNTVVLVQDDAAYLNSLSTKLNFEMAVSISNYEVGQANDISGTCADPAAASSSVTMENWSFTSMDSIHETEPGPEPNELVIEGVASNLGDCGDDLCSACSVAHWSDFPTDKVFICTDYTSYKYTNICPSNWDDSLCGTNDLCFLSYAFYDSNVVYDCRPLPDRLQTGPFDFHRKSCNSSEGLCALGCGGSACKRSWPAGDSAKWTSVDAMCRCKA